MYRIGSGRRQLPIAQLCHRVTSGGTPLRGNPSYYNGGWIPWVKTGELKDWYIDSTEEMITSTAIKETSAKLFPPNTVLLAMYGDGRTITSLGILRGEAASNQACCAMIVNQSICRPLFLFYSLMAERRSLIKLAYGGAQRNLNARTIREFTLSIPSLREQERIVDILRAYDDLIENNTRRIKILEEMAQMLYREWFVNFRFPGHEKLRMINSVLGQIPEGWTIKPLGEVSNVNELAIHPNSAREQIRYIDIASVSKGKIENVQLVNFRDAPGRARRLVRHGDVIWSTVRPNRRAHALILKPESNLIVSTGFAVLTATKIPFSYLHSAVTTQAFADYLTNHATGAAYPAVTGKDFENATLLVPTPALLTCFHKILEPMLELKRSLNQSNTTLRTTRDLLLPKLISGEIPVEAADEKGSEIREAMAQPA